MGLAKEEIIDRLERAFPVPRPEPAAFRGLDGPPLEPDSDNWRDLDPEWIGECGAVLPLRDPRVWRWLLPALLVHALGDEDTPDARRALLHSLQPHLETAGRRDLDRTQVRALLAALEALERRSLAPGDRDLLETALAHWRRVEGRTSVVAQLLAVAAILCIGGGLLAAAFGGRLPRGVGRTSVEILPFFGIVLAGLAYRLRGGRVPFPLKRVPPWATVVVLPLAVVSVFAMGHFVFARRCPLWTCAVFIAIPIAALVGSCWVHRIREESRDATREDLDRWDGSPHPPP